MSAIVSQRTVFFLWIILLAVLFLLIGNDRGPLRKEPQRYHEVEKYRRTKQREIERPTLPRKVVEKVKRFVIIVHCQGNRQSMVSTLLSANPHIIIAKSFYDRSQGLDYTVLSNHNKKELFFNRIYRRSLSLTTDNGGRGQTTIATGSNIRHGKFGNIDIIGTDSGGSLVTSYLQSRTEFVKWHQALKKTVSIPVKVIHTLQNPFDGLSLADSPGHNPGQNTSSQPLGWLFDKRIDYTLQQFDTVMKMIEIFGRKNVLDVHSGDLVADPRGTLSEVFEFLGIDVMKEYLDKSVEIVLESAQVARPRDSIAWTPEQIQRLEQGMQRNKMLNRYSFISD